MTTNVKPLITALTSADNNIPGAFSGGTLSASIQPRTVATVGVLPGHFVQEGTQYGTIVPLSTTTSRALIAGVLVQDAATAYSLTGAPIVADIVSVMTATSGWINVVAGTAILGGGVIYAVALAATSTVTLGSLGEFKKLPTTGWLDVTSLIKIAEYTGVRAALTIAIGDVVKVQFNC